jgi:hypothetical protein
MIRLCRAVTVLVILAGVARTRAQPSSGSPSSQAALEEAVQLNKLVEKLLEDWRLLDKTVFSLRRPQL